MRGEGYSRESDEGHPATKLFVTTVEYRIL
jgi:hypothetical protein